MGRISRGDVLFLFYKSVIAAWNIRPYRSEIAFRPYLNFYNKASGTHKRYIFSFCIHKYYVQVSAVVYTSIHLFVLALILGMFISQGTNSRTAKMEMFVCTMHCTMYISLPDYL